MRAGTVPELELYTRILYDDSIYRYICAEHTI